MLAKTAPYNYATLCDQKYTAAKVRKDYFYISSRGETSISNTRALARKFATSEYSFRKILEVSYVQCIVYMYIEHFCYSDQY